MIDIGSTIKQLLKESKITQKALAKSVDESEVNITRYLKGQRKIPHEVLGKIAKKLNVSVEMFYNTDEKPVKKVPIVATASCGGADTNFLQDEGQKALYNGEYWHKDLYCVIANGDSMAPEIEDGDEVICDPNVKASHGDMVHYKIDDESAIKVLVIDEDAYLMQFIPYNQSKDFKIKTIRLDDEDALQRLKYNKVVSVNKLKYNNKQARLKLVGRG